MLYSSIITTSDIGEFSELLYSSEINPLEYLEEIPNCFLDSSQEVKKVIIPDNIVAIGEYAFRESNIELINIPDSVKKIGDAAFKDCKQLQEVKLPKGLEIISTALFSGCNKLTKIIIPDSVVEIAPYAFNHCPNLKTIEFEGTKKQWQDVHKPVNLGVVDSKKIHCKDGEIDLTQI